MKLSSSDFVEGGRIPSALAFGKIDPATHVSLSDNLSPSLQWDDVPAGTKSFALICHDYDVPSKGDDVNQEGKKVPADLPRVDFFHWVLIEIPAQARSFARGQWSSSVTAKGKPGPEAEGGMRHGINDYTAWFAGDPTMGGDYYGYDGPCPPWNDSLIHHYVFTIYALDVESLDVAGRFGGAEVRKAIEGHILASATLTGTYSLNPEIA